MCGITGFINVISNLDAEKLTSLVSQMSDSIIHRGPDDGGHWVDAEFGIALGFRRLAIIDLSPAGHQPMTSADDRFVIVFNGEIYNFNEIRSELSSFGHAFRGHSDTEVILAAVSEWGLKSTLQKLNGMFAFVIWDKKERVLSLVRDRIGIKPLYYGWCGNTLLFGSELKSLRAHPDFLPEINRNALSILLRYGYIPAPYTIYEKINKLIPGSILQFQLNNSITSEETSIYWSAEQAFTKGLSNPFIGNETEVLNALDDMLTQSIGLRMIADVPLGAFLSGGIDSSTIVALMQKQSLKPIQTFTIGFREESFNEASQAKLVAQHLGTLHTELYVTAKEARDIIPLLPSMFDEPFADPSQIPTYLISRLAKSQVTVGLSGDGGDEFFGGYNRYVWVNRIWKNLHSIPLPVRKLVSSSLELLSPEVTSNLLRIANKNLPNQADKIKKIISVLGAPSPEYMYVDLLSHWKTPDDVVIHGFESTKIVNQLPENLKNISITEKMMLLDQLSYLPDDVLAKVDRASMRTSLEVRAPLLDDHQTIEFSYRIPMHMKIRNGEGKWILKQLLNRYIPQALTERPKMGFGVPISSWLRGPLRNWANDLLSETKLHQDGFFNASIIQKKWHEHSSGSKDWQYELWIILMFQAWLNEAKN